MGQVVELNAEVGEQTGASAGLVPLLVNVETAAWMLGIGHTLAKELVATGDLPTVRIKTRRLVRVADLQTFVEELQ